MADRYAYTGADGADANDDYRAVIIGVGQPTAGASGKRGWVYDLMWGTSQTPNDNQIIYKLYRCTAHDTSEATPAPLDPAAATALLKGLYTWGQTTTTLTDVLLRVGANQRSTQRWVAAPGGEVGIANSSEAGVAFSAIHSSGCTVEATLHFEE